MITMRISAAVLGLAVISNSLAPNLVHRDGKVEKSTQETKAAQLDTEDLWAERIEPVLISPTLAPAPPKRG